MTAQSVICNLERERFKLQSELDQKKTQCERNRMGQFATPPPLAENILAYAKTLLPEDKGIRFLDPAIGTGAFYSALLKVFSSSRIEEAQGLEVDPHYGVPAAQLWADSGLKLRLGDFTRQHPPPERFNLVICNPPYVRHHHLEIGEKTSLQARTLEACGIRVSGLAGLYCYFLGLSHRWLEEGAISGWLIPSEFMDVNYGQALKRYLLERVTLLHIHRFDPNDVQFADALVSSAVVWFSNARPPKDHTVRFTFGGTLERPALSKMIPVKTLSLERKWTRFPTFGLRQNTGICTIGDFFKIKRGIATGHNDYFILSAEEVAYRKLPMECFRPILPSPRYLTTNEIQADTDGNPLLERRLFLLDVAYDEDEIRVRFPAIWNYLQEGKAGKLHHSYLCRHRARWYEQENRPPAPLVCTYLGRGDSKNGRPFRFILNHSRATVANVYLVMYPTPLLSRAVDQNSDLLRTIWQILNGITRERLLGEGRVYGGGLHKLEPSELANLPVPEIAELLPKQHRPANQAELFHEILAD